MKYSTYNPSNIEDIKQLFTKTFSDSEGQSEGLTIGNLVDDLMTRTDADDLYGFVATENQQIIGCIFFSRLMFESKVNAFLLSPVAIDTGSQGKGIGQKLIDFGLNTLKKNGVELAFTYGDPNFYAKVGFSPIAERLIKAPLTLTYPEGWLAQSLVSNKVEPITGNSHCVDAFNKPEIW
jgi:putative acetyltransferase